MNATIFSVETGVRPDDCVFPPSSRRSLESARVVVQSNDGSEGRLVTAWGSVWRRRNPGAPSPTIFSWDNFCGTVKLLFRRARLRTQFRSRSPIFARNPSLVPAHRPSPRVSQGVSWCRTTVLKRGPQTVLRDSDFYCLRQ